MGNQPGITLKNDEDIFSGEEKSFEALLNLLNTYVGYNTN